MITATVSVVTLVFIISKKVTPFPLTIQMHVKMHLGRHINFLADDPPRYG